MDINLSQLLTPETIILNLKANNKIDCLKQLVRRLEIIEKIKNPKEFIEELLKREEQGSTYMGYGIALPHARTDLVDEIVMTLAISKKGIPFDNEKANIIFLTGTPTKEVKLYLQLIAKISKMFRESHNRELLLNSKNEEEIINNLKELESIY